MAASNVWYERIRKYYIDGYGPGPDLMYYTDEDVAKFVPRFITEEQKEQLYIEKQKKLGTYVEPEPEVVEETETVEETTEESDETTEADEQDAEPTTDDEPAQE